VRVDHDDGAGSEGGPEGEGCTDLPVEGPGAVVADDDGVGVRDGRRYPGSQGRGGVGGEGVVRVVEAQHDLVAGQDPVLGGRTDAGVLEQVRGVHAGVLEDAVQEAARVVVADQPAHAHAGAERREVHGRVRRAAGRVLAARDVDDRSGRLPAEPLDGAAPPPVEHRVTDHRDGRRTVRDGGRHPGREAPDLREVPGGVPDFGCEVTAVVLHGVVHQPSCGGALICTTFTRENSSSSSGP